MPVGQEVIAKITGLAGSPAGAGAVLAAGTGAGAAAGLGSSGWTIAEIRAAASAGVLAARNEARKSLRTSALESLANSFMWASPVPSGAAMPMIRSAGPSFDPKSTGSASRISPSDASLTAAARQCGIAMPPGMPVVNCASRFSNASSKPARSARPLAAINVAISAMTACLSPVTVTPSLTSSGVISGSVIAFPL